MKKIEGYDVINEVGEFKNLPAGCYALKIRKVVDCPDREYLEVYFDIAEGEFKGYYTALEASTGKEGIGKSIRSYKTNALPFFKSFITAIEKSNQGYAWNWDENTLAGKFCAGEFGEEEYLKDGEVKVGVKIDNFRSLQALREGKCKIPERKVLPESERPIVKSESDVSMLEIPDGMLPF